MSGVNDAPVVSGLPPEELALLLAPQPRFRATQIVKWIASGAADFAAMDNLPLHLRNELAERFTLRPAVEYIQHKGDDGTVKLTVQFNGGAQVEAVLLRSKTVQKTVRYTACISTQAGCPAGCIFCKTGSLGFHRNLHSAEIVEQFLLLKAIALGGEPSLQHSGAHAISSIVIMGMGEPLLNLDELRKAITVISSPQGLNVSCRRITVSTCGIVDGIISLADTGPAIRLALSLPSADENLRQRLMPISAGHPLPKIKKALHYFQKGGGGRITLEVVLLGGINTGSRDAAGIAQFAAGLDTVVNLIPWNPVPGLVFEGKPLREASAADLASFSRQLEKFGLKVTRRFRRGRGVMGACGQLG